MARKATGPRLMTLQPRVRELQPRLAPLISSSSGWNKGDAPKRLTGRVLQRRNQRIKVAHGYTCADCGRITMDLEIDHRIPMHLGGDDSDENCQPLCFNADGTGCHQVKTKAERQALGLG